MKSKSNIKLLIFAIAAILIIISIYLAFIYAPTHEELGETQRIFYFHVATAWVSYVAFGVTFAGGLIYLRSKDFKWDTMAYDSAQIGLMFCTLALITGSLWARAAWGVFWKWEDLKLLITLVLWLVFIAYLALRANTKSRAQKANLSAVFGIIGVICIPLSFAADRIWQQYHPAVIATSRGSLQSSMGFALGVAVLAFTFLYVYFLLAKMDIDKMKEKIEDIKQQIGDKNV